MTPVHEREEFRQVWQTPSGFPGWMSAVNNQPLGRRFMATAFIFFLLGGILALLMRIQLTVPENTFLGPDVYNQFFTMHGSTMMYLFAVPFLEGLAVYLVPLLIGSRDLAFPRLTAFGYWTYLFGGLVFYASFLFGAAPNVGWFAYTPLSEDKFSGLGVDFWLLGLSLVEVAGITAGVEIIVTILKFRAVGMTLNRMPLLIWALLVAAGMMVFAFTTLLTATVLLELDRAIDTRFFDPGGGGTTLLWQHLFWFFGHPEVYIIFIPATGIVSMVVTAFAGRISGYILIVVALIVTGFVSFGLWVHHMYTTGLPELSMAFFAAASLMISIASGIQIFAWIASLWGTAPRFDTPLLYVLGFIFIFVLGGLTGVMIAVVPFDWQVHDTYFIVAHFHYVLIGGAVFPVLAGLHFWLPKITGRMLNETLGKWSFWLAFLGFNAAFFPMHIMGFEGMPRRVYTYPSVLGITTLNVVSTIGAVVLAGGFLLFVINYFLSTSRGRRAGANPWGADSLEWSLRSPPPSYSYLVPPRVEGLHPEWDRQERTQDALAVDAASDRSAEQARVALASAPLTWRATLSTDAVHARPEAIQPLPGPTYVPLFTSLGLLVAAVGVLGKYYLLAPVGGIFALGAIAVWMWTPQSRLEMLRDSALAERAGLPIFTTGPRSTAWWGAVGGIAVLATVLATLLYSYFYIRLYSTEWPQGNLPLPDWMLLPAIAYPLPLVAAGAAYWAGKSLQPGRTGMLHALLTTASVLGAAFVALAVAELLDLEFAPSTNAYASLFYVLTWHLIALVIVIVLLTAGVQLRLTHDNRGLDEFVTLQFQILSMFWIFVAVVTVLTFATLYLSPYVI